MAAISARQQAGFFTPRRLSIDLAHMLQAGGALGWEARVSGGRVGGNEVQAQLPCGSDGAR